MVEPFNMTPAIVAKLTDFQILGILMRQAENVRKAREDSQPQSRTAPPAPPPTENVRQGAAYDYLISSGMSPDEAERVIRGRK